MSDPELDGWLAGLARPVDEGADDAEAAALRLALARADADALAAVPADAAVHAAARERLLFRLRRERLMTRPRWPIVALALAAGVAALVVVPRWMATPPAASVQVAQGQPPTFRGDVRLVTVHRADPRRAAETLASVLKAHGDGANLYVVGEVCTVDTRIGPEPAAEVVAALKALGVAAPPGMLRVVVER